MDDIMFGEEDAKYIKRKPKRKVKKSKHKHDYIWAIGETASSKYPQVLVKYCPICGKVDTVRIPFLHEDIKEFEAYRYAKRNDKVFIPLSSLQDIWTLSYV